MPRLTAVLLEHFAGALDRTGLERARIGVAFSGGMDSMVLLDLLVRVASIRPIRQLRAIHVNHGLSKHADEWQAFCEARCAKLRVPFTPVCVQVPRARGESLEAAARTARYAVFREQDVDAIALAHHLDDQAETVLLQLLRGAGPRGMAAMPHLRRMEGRGPLLFRPLLDVARKDLVRYAKARKLTWVDDESNARLEFDRNYVRHVLVPHIEERFPGCRQTLYRASRNFAEAAELADALAGMDAAGAVENGTLGVGRLRELPAVRASNLLRWFLAQQGVQPPARERLHEALRQLIVARDDAHTNVDLGGGVRLGRHRGRAYTARVLADAPAGWSLEWRGERELVLPAGLGRIVFEPGIGAGLSVARFANAAATVRARMGGERIKLAADRPSRTLKNLLQEAGIPPWRRERLPLLFCGEALVWVPGLGMDVRYAAAAEEAGIVPRWFES